MLGTNILKNRKNMRLYFPLIFLLSSVCSLAAQIKISGIITDSDTNNPIEYSNLALLRNDSTFVNRTLSDSIGFFVFDNIPHGNYIISVSVVGYEKVYIPLNEVNQDINIGILSLKASSFTLKDVTVTANAVIQKIDRKLIIPSKAQIRVSDNGLTLLRNLQLSRLIINPIDNSISTLGNGAVQLRINGVLVNIQEIVALQPDNVIRIEYHDDPGMRYGKAGAVIDYIVRRKDTGGSISTLLANEITGKNDWGENYLSGKINHKKSEFSINTYWRRRGIEWTRENEETFILPNKTLVRKEIGEPTKLKDNSYNLALNYNLNEPDKYVFNLRFRNNYQDIPNSRNDRNSTIYSSDNTLPISVSEHSTWLNNTPSIDLYYQRNLKKDRIFILNIVGIYLDSRSTRKYTEKGADNSLDIYSCVNGDKYSFIGEAIYEHILPAGKLSTGLKHSQSYTQNEYTGNYSNTVNLRTAETFAYAEYMVKIKKITYVAGIGMTRTYNNQEDRSYEKYILRPNIRVIYNINSNAYIRYNGFITSDSPSLSDMNDIQMQIDSFQIRRGNPELKTVTSYIQTLNTGYNKGACSAELFVRYSYDHKPTMEQITYEPTENGDFKFFRTVVNQKGYHKLYSSLYLKLKPWKDYVSISLTPGYNYYISNGNNFRHTYSYWRLNTSIYGIYKKWSAGFEGYTRWNDFNGETKVLGEKYHTLNIKYTTPKWSLGLRSVNPFSTYYDQKVINYSKLLPSISHVYTDNMKGSFILTFSANIKFGRQFKTGEKRLENDDSDAGIMSGSKR